MDKIPTEKCPAVTRLNNLCLEATNLLAPRSPLFNCVMQVLNDPRFVLWTGSLDHKHHCGVGGLVKHVDEVWNIASSMSAPNMYLELPRINRGVLFTAVIFHDYGKLWDYGPALSEGSTTMLTDLSEIDKVIHTVPIYWVGSPHKRKIHHISRSNTEWVKIASLEGVPENVIDEVSHCILSHHGCRAWGSPIEPATPEAWLLHLADMASARQEELSRGVDQLTRKLSK